MPEPIATQTAGGDSKTVTVTAPNAVQAPVTQKPSDLITRASQVSLEQPQNSPVPGAATDSTIKLDQATIDKITDPALKSAVTEAYKSMQADYTRKTQAVAEKARQFEQQVEAMKLWTPERVQQELQNPSFIQAAQEYQRAHGAQAYQPATAQGDLTPEELSYLSPEQQKMYEKTKQMEQTLAMMNGRLQSAEVEKQDMTLRSKYANYDPRAVDEIYRGMMSGAIQATREHLWKVQDYDAAVQRAYALGQQDAKTGITQARQATTPSGAVTTQTTDPDIPVKQKGESHQDFFRRLAASAKAKLGQQ